MSQPTNNLTQHKTLKDILALKEEVEGYESDVLYISKSTVLGLINSYIACLLENTIFADCVLDNDKIVN